ncbi:sporulation protein [Streptomyces sp. RKCA744]|uniref:sporulation protein n=1 Tax=Streptomyces sp. RKCA744 TaxID=2959340 RepID=UPI00209D25C6|nr:sporulation protein [Streptomyces sp. RKCA744]MCO8305835.1 sporulation protein [Streptomyces sp. RKCA744]
MVFKRVLGSLGVGGPTVDTVLEQGAARPGGVVRGQVRLRGGDRAYDIEHIAVELAARVGSGYGGSGCGHSGHGGDGHGGSGDDRAARGGSGYGEAARGDAEPGGAEGTEGAVVFDRHRISGGFRLDARERRDVPFTLHIPWETPLTELSEQPLSVVLGVRPELAAGGAKDHGELEQLIVRPLPAQKAVLGALGRLGFSLVAAHLRLGHTSGTRQTLPFHQEIELTPAPRYIHDVSEIALTLLAGPHGVEVVLEADKRGRVFSGRPRPGKPCPGTLITGGLFTGGPDVRGRHTVSHDGLGDHDWTAEVDSWLQALIAAHTARTSPKDADGRHGGREEGHDVRRRPGPGPGPGTGAGIAGTAGTAGTAGVAGTAGTAGIAGVAAGTAAGAGGGRAAAGLGDALRISGLEELAGSGNLEHEDEGQG